ncbi:MAG TPA: glycosyltransferase family 1 protein [Chloroflexia bacterium]
MMATSDALSRPGGPVAGRPLRVTLDMTFPNRFPVWGFSVYARSLLEALQARSDVSAHEISGPVASNPRKTAGWLVSGARRDLLKHPADVLHCPAFVTPVRVPAAVVINIHDAAAQRFPQDYPLEWRVYNRFILPLVARGAGRIIALSEFSRQEAIKYYGVREGRVVVAPAAPDPRYKPQSHEATERLLAELGLPVGEDRVPLLLFSGAPFRRKNLDVVLRAMSGAAEGSKLSEALLLISGATESGFEEYRASIAAGGLRQRVRWLGRVLHESMPALYGAVDMLVYPSVYEGFGLPPLEAMSVGTPVVAASASCLPDVLGDAALLVPPDDAQGFAHAMNSLLTNEALRQKMVAAGQARAATYTWERSARQTLEAYMAAANMKGRRS